MKIQYASDLHLEFSENKKFLKQNPIQPLGDILLLAGDIVPFAVMDKHSDFFNYISDNFQTSYWIPGNHEYYHFDIANKAGAFNEKIKTNVFLVNNTSIIHDNVKFVFSTLWSKISAAYEWQIEKNMNDFHVIKYKGYRFSAKQYNQLHEESIQFIKQEQHQHNTDKTIIVTHHVPTLLNYPEKYKRDILNEAFAVELFSMIEENEPDYWIFGHHHNNIDGFSIGKTRMLTNQLGYIEYGEHKLFRTNKIFNV